MPIGDKAWEEFIASSEGKRIFKRVMVHLDEKAPENIVDDDFLFDPNLKFTNGHYELIYRPFTKQSKYAGECPFIVRCDMLPALKVRVANYGHLKKIGEENPIIAWLIKWCPLSRELFDLARTNFGTPISFTVDWLAYARYIKENNPENKVQLCKEEWKVGEKYRAQEVTRDDD